MRSTICSGKGINLKSGKEIKFIVPEEISTKGLENLRKNVRVTSELLSTDYQESPLAPDGLPPIVEKIITRAIDPKSGSRSLAEIKEMLAPFQPEKVIDTEGVVAQEDRLLESHKGKPE